MIEAVAAALTDSLRKPRYRGNPNPLAGHCYVASEALFHLLGGKSAGFTPMFVYHEGEPHWFLRGPDGFIDITASQFTSPVPYDRAVAKGFLTKSPSKRAQQVIDTVSARV